MSKELLFDFDEIEDVLLDGEIGVWRIEIEPGQQPRMYGDAALARLFEIEGKQLTPQEVYETWDRGIDDGYRVYVERATNEILENKCMEVVYPWIRSDGIKTIVRCRGYLGEQKGNIVCLKGIHQDITHTEQARIQQLELAALPKILEADYYLIYSIDIRSKTIVLEQSTESVVAGIVIGTPVDYEIWYKTYIEKHVVESYKEEIYRFFDVEVVKKAAAEHKVHDIIYLKKVRDKERYVEAKIFPVEYVDGVLTRCIAVGKDVHDAIIRDRENQALLHEALEREKRTQKTLSTVIYDRMTGLYGKEYFYEKGYQLLEHNQKSQFVFMLIDIEDFKAFNSIAGVEEGNRLIQYMAKSLEVLLEKETLSVYGRNTADQFLVIIQNEERQISYLQDGMKKAIEKYKHTLPIKIVFGEYVITDAEEELHLIQDKATLAVKTCKGIFGKYIGRYTTEMEERLMQKRLLSKDMEKAIEKEEFVIYYQPKFNAKSLKICGAEALVRWNHRSKQLLSPGIFIPLFEENGFIRHLDFYVWNKACQFIYENSISIPISVNVSRANMYSAKLQNKLLYLLERYKVDSSMLYLEFTESAYYNDMQNMQNILLQLQEKGFVISMDDFGTGYSSLGLLKDVSVNELKIDASFIDFTQGDDRSLAILESIVMMSKRLNLHVTVEGVETKEQLELVQELQCDTVQGYHLAMPMCEEDFLKFLKKVGTHTTTL